MSPPGTLPIIEEELQNHIQKTKLKICGGNSEVVDKYFTKEVLIRDRLKEWVDPEKERAERLQKARSSDLERARYGIHEC